MVTKRFRFYIATLFTNTNCGSAKRYSGKTLHKTSNTCDIDLRQILYTKLCRANNWCTEDCISMASLKKSVLLWSTHRWKNYLVQFCRVFFLINLQTRFGSFILSLGSWISSNTISLSSICEKSISATFSIIADTDTSCTSLVTPSSSNPGMPLIVTFPRP